MKIIECVPNFSEGRRQGVIKQISDAAQSVDEITILDCESDPNHNRMVLTFVGPPEAVKKAALMASAKAIELIDPEKTHRRTSENGRCRCGSLRPVERGNNGRLRSISKGVWEGIRGEILSSRFSI